MNAAEGDLPRQHLSGQGPALRGVLIIRRPIKAPVSRSAQTRRHRQIIIERYRLRDDARNFSFRRRELHGERSGLIASERSY